MNFLPTLLPGVWLIELDLREDERGFFARTYCEREFAERGLNTRWPQVNLTCTLRRGMIRGLHYQADPKPEIKLIRCSAGAIFDVVTDVRPDSPTYGRWETFQLTASNRRQLFVPGGFAHGFQCLEDRSEVLYLMSESYDAELARGVRWDDPSLGIPWPIPNPLISARDAALPFLRHAIG
jgi:dTDP-4-dehydrorhamnose 3,5-epimerase